MEEAGPVHIAQAKGRRLVEAPMRQGRCSRCYDGRVHECPAVAWLLLLKLRSLLNHPQDEEMEGAGRGKGGAVPWSHAADDEGQQVHRAVRQAEA